jgi:hypothetical protein
VSDSAPGDVAFDLSRPHISRVYDYLLGGKDNFAADRAVGDRIIASLPMVQLGVKAQRAVLERVVRYLVADVGIRQLIDIGSGLPTADNVHQVAHRSDPATRVVYVDNDPVVLTHARALLTDEVTTIAVAGDLREPENIIADSAITSHLDWDQPIGLLLCGILHHIQDDEQPGALVKTMIEALPPASYVFIHHLLDSPDPAVAEVQAAMQAGMGRGQFRTREQVLSFFAGLDLVEPGLVYVSDWRPDATTLDARDQPVLRLACAGVGRKS